MKVYVLIFGVDYEGETLEGIFSSKELAQAKLETLKQALGFSWQQSKTGSWWHRDTYLDIKEYTVDQQCT